MYPITGWVLIEEKEKEEKEKKEEKEEKEEKNDKTYIHINIHIKRHRRVSYFPIHAKARWSLIDIF